MISVNAMKKHVIFQVNRSNLERRVISKASARVECILKEVKRVTADERRELREVLLETGASFCILERGYGKLLGLNEDE